MQRQDPFQPGATTLVVGPHSASFGSAVRNVLGHDKAVLIKWSDAKGYHRLSAAHAAEPGATFIVTSQWFPTASQRPFGGNDETFLNVLRTTGVSTAKILRLRQEQVEPPIRVRLFRASYVVEPQP